MCSTHWLIPHPFPAYMTTCIGPPIMASTISKRPEISLQFLHSLNRWSIHYKSFASKCYCLNGYPSQQASLLSFQIIWAKWEHHDLSKSKSSWKPYTWEFVLIWNPGRKKRPWEPGWVEVPKDRAQGKVVPDGPKFTFHKFWLFYFSLENRLWQQVDCLAVSGHFL